MRTSPRFAVVLLIAATLGRVAPGQESSEVEFRKYGETMQGHWLGNIKLWNAIPGIGKAGDELQVRWTLQLTADDRAIVGVGTDDDDGEFVSKIAFNGVPTVAAIQNAIMNAKAELLNEQEDAQSTLVQADVFTAGDKTVLAFGASDPRAGRPGADRLDN